MKIRTALSLFSLLLIILILPGVIFLSGQRQELRKFASESQPIALMGRVTNAAKQYSACTDGRYYYGADFLCLNTPRRGECWGEPDYQITWEQSGRQGMLNSNQCYGQSGVDLPRYTFESVANPLGSVNGEWVNVIIKVNGDVNLKYYHSETTNDAGQILLEPDSRQTGTFAQPGPNQTLRVKVYNKQGYYLNHLWFFASENEIIPTPTVIPTITPRPATRGWFQTQEGDVYAVADIYSLLPAANDYFSLAGIGGFPGVVVYGKNAGFGEGKVSEKSWLAQNTLRLDTPARTYNYFYDLLNKPNTDNFDGHPGEMVASGVYYSADKVEVDQPWNLPGNKQAVVFINGNLRINQEIKVPDTSFLAIIVKGNIEIRSTVENIEGVMIVDGVINTNYDSGDSRLILVGKGVFVASDFIFGRDFQEFQLRPDFLLNSYLGLWQKPMSWEEVNP